MQASDVLSSAPTCPYTHPQTSYSSWNWVIEWAKNNIGWFSDMHHTGCLNFLENVMRLPPEEGEGFCPFKWVPVAHRLNTVLITDFKYWSPLFGKHKGEEVKGGVELDKLGDLALTRHTPLTIDDPIEHKKIKSFCKENNFGYPSVKENTPQVIFGAQGFFNHTCFRTAEGVNISEIVRQYVSRTNTLALFGPAGSRAETTLRPLFFNPDGSPNEGWDKVPQAVDTLGQAISDWVMYNPTYYANRLKDSVGKHVWGDQVEGGVEKQKKALQEAVDLMIAKSKEALTIPSEKAIKGQLELMIESGEYTPEQIEGMARLVLVIGQRTTSVALEACILNLVRYPEWQERLRADIKESLKGEAISHAHLNSSRLLDRFIWETLRLYPPVPVQTREANQDMEFEDLKVTQGTTLMMAHFLAQKDPRHYKNPQEFNPMRFETEKISHMNTFGKAPHDCAGRMLALTCTIKVAIATLLSEHNIIPVSPEELSSINPVGGFILKFNKPLLVRFEKK